MAPGYQRYAKKPKKLVSVRRCVKGAVKTTAFLGFLAFGLALSAKEKWQGTHPPSRGGK